MNIENDSYTRCLNKFCGWDGDGVHTECPECGSDDTEIYDY